MPSTFSCLVDHYVWSTKNRLPLITPGIRPRLYPFIGGIVRDLGGTMYEIGGVEDHVHVLVRGKTDVSAAEMARNIKSRSTAWLRETFDGFGSFAWQEGYGVFSVSKSQVEGVKAYIRRQEEHHERRSFKEEFIEFLERHEIEYKPEFVFD